MTPDTTFTSPWLDTYIPPDDCLVNMVTQGTSPAVNANEIFDPTSISVLTEAISPADKVDSWFASDHAGPNQSSMSCPITRDTALPSLAVEQRQLSNQTLEDTDSNPFLADPSKCDLITDSFPDEQSQRSTTQIEVSTRVSSSSVANQAKLSTSHLGFRDPFFDTVPKGPSQLSTSRRNPRAPVFDSWDSTQGQAPTLSLNRAESLLGAGKHP